MEYDWQPYTGYDIFNEPDKDDNWYDYQCVNCGAVKTEEKNGGISDVLYLLQPNNNDDNYKYHIPSCNEVLLESILK